MVLSKLKTYGDLVMFQHTLFALPFALIGVLLAAGGLPTGWQLFWVLVAMFGARNGANALNRLVDSEIDAMNPRTVHRHLPRGLVKKWEVALLVLICFVLFVLAAYMLNPLCLALLPIPMAIFVLYSYTKRFTWLCHLILGAGCGGAPMGGWLAIRGAITYPDIIPPFLLWGAVALWVAGFDIIYGTQDVEFDRNHGLHSIPAAFGIPKALWISRAFHFIAVILLAGVGLIMDLGWLYWIGTVVVAGLLVYEHSLVSPDNPEQVKIASYSVNEIIGVFMLVFTFLDVMLLR
ncbi:MAG: UbiA-like polyprenyltransferase [Clostridia bacterium]|jgi:4-hydroxybenzoate polyprenyltransferase